MPLRDLAVTLIIFGSLPFCFARPWIGILMWSWLGYMNPNRTTWGFAYSLPFAEIVAVTTLAGFVLSRDRKPFIWCRSSVLLVALWLWFTVTTCFAEFPASAWPEWERVSKILLMAFLTVPLFQDRRRLRILLLVIALSIGYYGLRGGVFVLLTGGRYTVWGPPGGTAISANNGLGLGLNMCIPLLIYLAREESVRWRRGILSVLALASILTVPFTYSRGAVLGLGVVLLLMLLKTRGKVVLLPLAVLGIFVFATLAPERWTARMGTLEHYHQDASANERLTAWHVGYLISRDHPVLGGGFEVFNHQETYDRYVPELHNYFDAHSVYFNLLGEHGYPGLLLFLLLVGSTLASLRRIRRVGRARPDLLWAARYADMIEISLVAYLVTGVFLSAAYFDLAYHLLIIGVILDHLMQQEVAEMEPADSMAGTVRQRTGAVTRRGEPAIA